MTRPTPQLKPFEIRIGPARGARRGRPRGETLRGKRISRPEATSGADEPGRSRAGAHAARVLCGNRREASNGGHENGFRTRVPFGVNP